jgi:predicted metalloprotease
MAEIRETEVERDADGRVIAYKERVSEHVDDKRTRRSGGGKFGIGILLGVLVLAVAIIAFAYSQGGFQQAGVEADQAAAVIEEKADQAVGATDTALQDAADTTQQAVNETTTSDTATN